jgi:tetratricopeptide (TPR) repeat protein
MADSLAQNKSLLFKINLAATALRMGAVELARKKYEEINKYFPYTHEGHYGYAVTSTMLGDHDKGLQQIYIAIYKYKKKYDKEPEDALFLKAVLLSMNNRHEDAVSTFKSIDKEYLEHDAYKVHYAYSLFKVAEIDDDDKIRKQAFKLYNKIKDKNAIPKEYDIQLLDKQ